MATGHMKSKAREGQEEKQKAREGHKEKENAENIAHRNSVTKGQRENSMATGHMKHKASKGQNRKKCEGYSAWKQ